MAAGRAALRLRVVGLASAAATPKRCLTPAVSDPPRPGDRPADIPVVSDTPRPVGADGQRLARYSARARGDTHRDRAPVVFEARA